MEKPPIGQFRKLSKPSLKEKEQTSDLINVRFLQVHEATKTSGSLKSLI